MGWYGIHDGSIVNPAEPILSGHIAMVIINEQASIKKVYERDSGLDLVSAVGACLHVPYEDIQDGHYIHICDRVMLVISSPDEGA